MNFSDVEVKPAFESKFLNPGVCVVKFSTITAGTASTGTPFLELTVEDDAGLTATSRLYFAEGQNKTISVETLYIYLAITNGLDINNDTDKPKIKALIGDFSSYEDLASKLSSKLVGKVFATVLRGEYVNPTDLAKPSWIKAVLGSSVATVANKSKLVFDATKHMDKKKVKDNRKANGSTTNDVDADSIPKAEATPW
jgi:hypothetical protein